MWPLPDRMHVEDEDISEANAARGWLVLSDCIELTRAESGAEVRFERMQRYKVEVVRKSSAPDLIELQGRYEGEGILREV